jgi:hypothetical protein
MVNDPDTFRAAKLLIDQHCKGAPLRVVGQLEF